METAWEELPSTFGRALGAGSPTAEQVERREAREAAEAAEQEQWRVSGLEHTRKKISISREWEAKLAPKTAEVAGYAAALAATEAEIKALLASDPLRGELMANRDVQLATLQAAELERLEIAKKVDEPILISNLVRFASPKALRAWRLSQGNLQRAVRDLDEFSDRVVRNPSNVYLRDQLEAVKEQHDRAVEAERLAARAVLQD